MKLFIPGSSTLAAAVLALAGCGSDGTRPDDMSAADHRAAASGAEQEAGEHEGRYDPEARRITPASRSRARDITYPRERYNPTERHLEHAAALEELARRHRAAAAALEGFEEQECGAFPAETRAACPLLGQVVEASDIEGGVRLTFTEDVDMEAVLAHVRCHLAFARTQGREGMDACPLYLDSVSAAPDGDPRAVDLTCSTGTCSVDELRSRARAHVVR